MLLEMQSAMNNMMNNSQLHSQLHSSQTLPIAKPLPASSTEATSEDGGSAPSCSPSSSPCSSRSDAGSDPEPTVTMDTSPSSASPSASDSGEEEVIGSVTRAHQETFMYNQEQSSLTAPAPAPATGPLKADCDQNGANRWKEERQDAWNHHNNMVTMAAQEPSSGLGPQGPEGSASSHCPFRLSRSQQGSHCPAYTHTAFRAAAAHDQAGTAGFSGLQWREGKRMHLVSVCT